MFFQEALKIKSQIKRPSMKRAVTKEYIEASLNPSNPLTEDEFEEIFGYLQPIDFTDLLANDWT